MAKETIDFHERSKRMFDEKISRLEAEILELNIQLKNLLVSGLANLDVNGLSSLPDKSDEARLRLVALLETSKLELQQQLEAETDEEERRELGAQILEISRNVKTHMQSVSDSKDTEMSRLRAKIDMLENELSKLKEKRELFVGKI